ncbi:MAG: hypothetical protein AAFQ91_23755 [Cyanobacteria bacterium J06621_15]
MKLHLSGVRKSIGSLGGYCYRSEIYLEPYPVRPTPPSLLSRRESSFNIGISEYYLNQIMTESTHTPRRGRINF